MWLTSFQLQAESSLKAWNLGRAATCCYDLHLKLPRYAVFCDTKADGSYELKFEITKHDALFAKHQRRSSVLYVKTYTTHSRHFASMQSDKTIGDVKCYFLKWN